MEAQDIMTKDVIALAPEMTPNEATDLLLQYRIHGAPVVDASGQFLGMISFVDLAHRSGETVGSIMNTHPVCAAEDTSVDEIARLMLDQMVRRVPIVRGGQVVGIISASDIVRLFLNLHDQPRPEEARTGNLLAGPGRGTAYLVDGGYTAR